MNSATLATLVHLLVVVAVIASVVVLCAFGKVSGDTSMIVILATAGVSVPTSLATAKLGQ